MIPVVFAGKREQQAADKGIASSGGIDDLHARGGKKELSLGGDEQRPFGPQRNDGGITAQINCIESVYKNPYNRRTSRSRAGFLLSRFDA